MPPKNKSNEQTFKIGESDYGSQSNTAGVVYFGKNPLLTDGVGKKTTGFAKHPDLTTPVLQGSAAPSTDPAKSGKRVQGFSTENSALEAAASRTMTEKERRTASDRESDRRLEKMRDDLNAQAVRLKEEQRRKAEEYQKDLTAQIAAKQANKALDRQERLKPQPALSHTAGAPASEPSAAPSSSAPSPSIPSAAIMPRDERVELDTQRRKALDHRRALEEQIAARRMKDTEAKQRQVQEDRMNLAFMQQELVATYMLEKNKH